MGWRYPGFEIFQRSAGLHQPRRLLIRPDKARNFRHTGESDRRECRARYPMLTWWSHLLDPGLCTSFGRFRRGDDSIYSWAGLIGSSGLLAVGSFDLGYSKLKMWVPQSLAQILRGKVFSIRFPGADGFQGRPIRYGDAKSVCVTRAFLAEKTGLSGGEFDHPSGHPSVTIVAVTAKR